jgi:hypothetical protein
VVEDEKISLDELQQEIEEDEDHVQSTDIVCVPPIEVSCSAMTNMSRTGRYAEAVNVTFNELRNGMMEWTVMCFRTTKYHDFHFFLEIGRV